MKPLLVSSGEPAGVGPDLCLALAAHELPVVVLGDKAVLRQRADELKLAVNLLDYQSDSPVMATQKNCLNVLSTSCLAPVVKGELNSLNAPYVVTMLRLAADKCLQGEFAALITAPVSKSVINQAGIPFTGHTEFFADYFKVKTVVMMLSCERMRVALVTTHLPLKKVPEAITSSLISAVIEQLNNSLEQEFGISKPRLYVAGLNPHAGEGGYLGSEELEIIKPTLAILKKQGIDVHGPFPADTLFTPHNAQKCDAFVAMYHDQGLPVLKYCGFGSAVNITLGLPIIRTSVDHGTALELAGTGLAESGSLVAAVKMAASMAEMRKSRGHY